MSPWWGNGAEVASAKPPSRRARSTVSRARSGLVPSALKNGDVADATDPPGREAGGMFRIDPLPEVTSMFHRRKSKSAPEPSCARELAYRINDGIHVRLLWHPADDAVSIVVDDVKEGVSFERPVPGHEALFAFHTDTGTLTDAEHKPTVDAALQAAAAQEDVARVGDLVVSQDGKTAYATVIPATALGDMSIHEAEAILDTARAPAVGTDVQVEAGGQLGTKLSKPETHTSELIGIAAAMLILVLVFGTVTAMVLPIAVALFGLICGLSLISLLGHVVAVPDVAPTVATMIGLGVGIDYSLFIVTRARSARHDGMSMHDAIGHAAATSGSAVAFAGSTVVIALLALAVSGVSLITVLGQAAAIVVVVAVLASMTLLPALLGLCGDGIERLRIGRDKRPTLGHSTYWQRWGERLSRRPGLFAVASVVLLLALTAPVTNLGLGLTDQSSSPESTTARQAYDLMTESFGAGSNGALLVTANVDGPEDPTIGKLH